MIYVVAGWMRSGTSMMMAALEAGGIEPYRSEDRDTYAARRFDGGGYIGNPAGYYELLNPMMIPPDLDAVEGKAVKLVRETPLRLPYRQYRIVFMRRDGEEIRQSFQALTSRPMPPQAAGMITAAVEQIVENLRARSDVEMVEMPYRDVIARPVESLRRLGWPIDVEKAAAVIDPSLVRYRREELTEGV